jgi:DNA-directed RNA polymerase specialized sigma24 family protein
MQDRELVAAIAAGDPGGLAEAYDRYAAPLYAYCRFTLPDSAPPDDAAGAIRDTFIIATGRVQGLRDPDQLRAWLHAVARNECLRRLGGDGAAGLAGRAGPPDPDGPVPAVTPPAELREQVLTACADSTPTGRANRASVTHRAEPFGPSGFPKPIVPRGPRWWQEVRRHPRAAVGVASVAAAVLVAGIVAVAMSGSSPRAPAATLALGGGVPGSVVSSRAPGSAGASSPGHRAADAKDTPTAPVPGNGSKPARGTASAQAKPSARAASSSSPSASTSPSPSASPFPSPSPSPSKGTLAVTRTKLALSAVKGKAARGTFRLAAVGGPVSDYVIKVPAGVAGKVTVAPASGSLAAGGLVTVTVTVKSLVALDTKVTAEPGGLVITVAFSIKA